MSLTRIALICMAFCLLAGAAADAAETPPAIELHGYMQNRIYMADETIQYRAERVSLSTLARLPGNSQGYVEVYYHPAATGSGLYLESAYYDTPLWNGRLRAGKGRSVTFGITPSYGNRRTSNYGIVAETFTQDRIQGLQYTATAGMLDYGVGLETGYRLGTRSIGEVPYDTLTPFVPHLAFRDLPGSYSREVQATGRLSARVTPQLRLGASALFGTLDARDLDALKGIGTSLTPVDPRVGGTTPTPAIGAGFTGRNMQVSGLDLTWKPAAGLTAQAEWFNAAVSNLGYGAWNAMLTWDAPKGWKVIGRYGTKNMRVAPTANPLTWDTTQTSLSVVQPLRPGLWLQYEYEINGETTNNTVGVDNDLFFVELFTGF